ncbi:MAG: sigma 54-interacting transcriptional regulator [Deltaproteobacteria bacterium]|nr:sigma 54-interacting transcriptional regulator [Deltaproteobacteria bacterium]
MPLLRSRRSSGQGFSLTEFASTEKLYRHLQWMAGRKAVLGEMVSRNKEMQKIFCLCEEFAESSFPLTLIGARGVGKETLAREIHRLSGRSEWILWPHQGWQKHPSATFFVPFLAALSRAEQKELAHLIDLSLRLGEESPYRVIVSTLYPIEKLENEGYLTSELAYRLSSIRLYLPDLRERREDVLLLVEHFLTVLSGGCRQLSDLQTSTLASLLDSDWPDNGDGIKAVVEYLLLSKEIPPHLLSPKQTDLWEILRSAAQLPEAVKLLEKKMIAEALENAVGNKSKVSRELGISRSGLLQKLEEYQLI